MDVVIPPSAEANGIQGAEEPPAFHIHLLEALRQGREAIDVRGPRRQFVNAVSRSGDSNS